MGSLLKVRTHPEILKLFIVWFLVYLASHAVQTNWAYFTMYKFAWDEKTVGISLGVMGLYRFCSRFLIRKVHPKLGKVKEVFYTELCFTVLNVAFCIRSKEWMMYAILAIYCLRVELLGQFYNLLFHLKVSPKEQGDLHQGALTSVIKHYVYYWTIIDDSDFLFFSLIQMLKLNF